MKKIILLIFLATISSVGIIASENLADTDKELIEKYTPKLSIEFVIKEAKEYAKNNKKNFEDYYIIGAKYESSQKEWLVGFMGKVPRPGYHFSIWINDRTKEIRIMQGM